MTFGSCPGCDRRDVDSRRNNLTYVFEPNRSLESVPQTLKKLVTGRMMKPGIIVRSSAMGMSSVSAFRRYLCLQTCASMQANISKLQGPSRHVHCLLKLGARRVPLVMGRGAVIQLLTYI